jgi:hypothetical protein
MEWIEENGLEVLNGNKKGDLYWVPQNWRNNSMGQRQLMLEDNEKNN